METTKRVQDRVRALITLRLRGDDRVLEVIVDAVTSKVVPAATEKIQLVDDRSIHIVAVAAIKAFAHEARKAIRLRFFDPTYWASSVRQPHETAADINALKQFVTIAERL